ncbi:hypothetical protein Ngar_c02350 [Candidatus Nitrososphaera gargensis Ga9.2]|uniref:Transcription regulator AsnC/Lrp ligand binding domain-containing protein n=1 Tax=Nitrososphaera gargensis (strain Ga9.2) TaxID=1237085 RepID=K0IEI9_NITGG|nr:hypothetical protein Ngar_c02350 [Candidatus Nitrososphaera gargensis Ga9.2]
MIDKSEGAHRIEGRYDLIVKVKAETEHELKELISTNISTIQGIDVSLKNLIYYAMKILNQKVGKGSSRACSECVIVDSLADFGAKDRVSHSSQ